MRLRRLLAILALSFLAVAPCHAQRVPCNIPLSPRVFIGFDPPSPNASQQITVIAGYGEYRYSLTNPISAAVEGNSINVTILGTPWGFLPTAQFCASVLIGPLTDGTYTVNLFAKNEETSTTFV